MMQQRSTLVMFQTLSAKQQLLRLSLLLAVLNQAVGAESRLESGHSIGGGVKRFVRDTAIIVVAFSMLACCLRLLGYKLCRTAPTPDAAASAEEGRAAAAAPTSPAHPLTLTPTSDDEFSQMIGLANTAPQPGR